MIITFTENWYTVNNKCDLNVDFVLQFIFTFTHFQCAIITLHFTILRPDKYNIITASKAKDDIKIKSSLPKFNIKIYFFKKNKYFIGFIHF